MTKVSGGRYVGSQILGFVLKLVKAVFDQIADADNANELGAVHHGHMTEAFRRHRRHCIS